MEGGGVERELRMHSPLEEVEGAENPKKGKSMKRLSLGSGKACEK